MNTTFGPLLRGPCGAERAGGAKRAHGRSLPLSVASVVILLASRAATSGTLTEFAIPTPGSFPSDIVCGPDANLWFTEPGGNKIGRITPTGVITEFPVPTANGGPEGITSGSDGNLWFTEDSGKIGRITPAGVVTEYPIPTANSNPGGITSGPDANLWFTENNGSKIGRITPAGVITEFQAPIVSVPRGITSGPDGNLWFTEVSGNKIGRITPAGVITEFSVPTVNSSPNFITSGPDGNLWFTEASANKIGQITPAGVITEFPVPTPSSLPVGITSRPDANLWFTETRGNKIGRFSLGMLYYTLSACRVVDTRGAAGQLGGPPLGPSELRNFPLVGACGIPSDAVVVSGNVVVVGPSAVGDFRVYAADQPVPPTSVISFSAGRTRANNLLVPLSVDGTKSVTVQNDSLATVDVIFDVNGYFK